MTLFKRAKRLLGGADNKDPRDLDPSRTARLGKRKPTVELIDRTGGGPPLTFDLDTMRDTPAQMSSGERMMLYSLIYATRPERYLEVGTFRGGSALVVHAAMDASGNDRGRLYCIDPAPMFEPAHWEAVAARTQMINGFSPDILPLARDEAGEPFDFVLIDGVHELAATRADAEAVLPLVQDGAYILFHDSLHHEVSQAIDEFVIAHEEIVDFGTLTRESTFETREDGSRIRWGGLRATQVRRELSAL